MLLNQAVHADQTTCCKVCGSIAVPLSLDIGREESVFQLVTEPTHSTTNDGWMLSEMQQMHPPHDV